MNKSFAIWVNGKDAAHSGWLTESGALVANARMAIRFPSLPEATERLTANGYVDTTDVTVRNSAYVCDVTLGW